MSWRGSEEKWMDADPITQERAKRITDQDFWHYVDSQANGYPHPNECRPHPTVPGVRTWKAEGFDGEVREVFCKDWQCHRGNMWTCLASKSDLNRCAKSSSIGVPFCDFHFDRAWQFISAVVWLQRSERIELDVIAERQWALVNLDLDIAAVEDAKTLLLKSNERVYFYLADHAVKVGRSINPEQRVRTLTGTKAPEGIRIHAGTLLGTIPGGARVEGALHQRFRPHRLVGEWFDYVQVADAITTLLAERSEVAA